jgi:hypothetical protein
MEKKKRKVTEKKQPKRHSNRQARKNRHPGDQKTNEIFNQ